MCKGVSLVHSAHAPPDDFDNGFNWFDAIDDVLAEGDEELGFGEQSSAPGTTDGYATVPSGK
jgi:hypothetical protein